jgi:hypothetical protein
MWKAQKQQISKQQKTGVEVQISFKVLAYKEQPWSKSLYKIIMGWILNIPQRSHVEGLVKS